MPFTIINAERVSFDMPNITEITVTILSVLVEEYLTENVCLGKIWF